MQSQIDVRLIVHPDCKLTAIDDYSYLKWFGPTGELGVSIDNYVSIEFLTYKGNIVKNTIRFENFKSGNANRNFDATFPLFKDGMYSYYKFLIPKLTQLFVEYTPQNKNIYYTGLKNIHQEYDAVYLQNNQHFYYNGNIYKSNHESNISFNEPLEIEDVMSTYLDAILEKSEKVSYEDLIYSMEKDLLGDISLYCKKNTFTICNLINCFVSLQRQVMKKELTYSCKKIEDVSKQRDFLLSTIYVLDYLKDIKNFAEAQRIIDSVTECTTFCSNISNNSDCGCNG